MAMSLDGLIVFQTPDPALIQITIIEQENVTRNYVLS